MKVSCPFCGSENVSKKVQIDNYPIPFCADAKIRYKEYYCNECEEEGDFDGTVSKKILADIKKVNTASASKLFDDLAADGVTMSYFEKALRIPFRTTARWKRGEISQSALALLRIIRFSPRLLDVADDNFSERAQAVYQLSRPCAFFGRMFENTSGEISKEGETYTISYSGSQGVQASPRIESGAQAKLQASWVFEQ
jgi:hypothetical protein